MAASRKQAQGAGDKITSGTGLTWTRLPGRRICQNYVGQEVNIMARSAIPWVLVFLAGCALAQDSTPTFSAGTKLVQVDVVARSRGGPAKGLTKDDFTVFDNGKAQKISFFSVKSARTAGSAAAPLPPGAVSNRTERDDEALSHATVLLIDQKNAPQAIQALPSRES